MNLNMTPANTATRNPIVNVDDLTNGRGEAAGQLLATVFLTSIGSGRATGLSAVPTPAPALAPTPTPTQDDVDDVDDEPALSSYARCSDGQGTLSFLFFSEDDLELARAKAICKACGLQDECLSGAIEREEPYGVWGGKLVLDGIPVEVKRKRGRPRKNPVPVLVVEEAPLPPHLVA